MGIAAYVLAVIIAFNLGFYRSELFSPSISKSPPVRASGPAAKPENAALESINGVPSNASTETVDSAPVPTTYPEKPVERLSPESKSVNLEREASSTPTAGKEGLPLRPEDQRTLRQLNSGNPELIRAAARRLYKKQFENPILLDHAAEVLKKQYRQSPGTWLHVDAMAWICKALGRSGKPQYRQLLDTVAASAPSRKLSGYARKSSRELQ